MDINVSTLLDTMVNAYDRGYLNAITDLLEEGNYHIGLAIGLLEKSEYRFKDIEGLELNQHEIDMLNSLRGYPEAAFFFE